MSKPCPKWRGFAFGENPVTPNEVARLLKAVPESQLTSEDLRPDTFLKKDQPPDFGTSEDSAK